MELTAEKGPYDQFILFGDSITEQSCSQDWGFALTPALQDGERATFLQIYRIASPIDTT